jgi:C-terminal peptidase prc
MRAFAAALHGYLQSLPTVQEVVAVQPDTGVRTPPSTLSGTGRPPTHKPAGVSTVLPVPDSAAKPARVPSCGCVAGAIVCALLLIGLVAGSGGVIYWLKVHKTDDASGLAKKTDGTDANPGVPLGVGAQDLQRLGFGRPRIVLVGIDRYADPTITPRIHAEADARSLYDLFTNPDYLGVPKDQVRLLLGSPDEGRSSEPAGRDNVLGALQWLSANAGEDDLTIVGLFVQGASLGEYADQVCYLAADSTLRGRQSNAIAAVEVGAALERLKSRHLCVFLDVNFNAATARGPALPEVLSVPSFREFLGDDGTPRHGSIPGRNLFLANQCLAPSLELPDHGLLARLVGDGLRGAADHDGYEPDGYVTLDELRRYVQREGRELARRQGISRRDRNQLPAAYGWNSSFALTQNPAVMPRVRQRLARIDALAAGARISPDVAVEARVLLTRMPRSEGRRELRKEYQKLADGMTSVENFLPVREQLVASMRVSPEEAGEFANKVLGAVDLVREHYVKELDPADMVGWTIRRLYQALDEELPSDFAARLRGLKGKDRDEWKRLLTHVRASLGKREDLADGKDVDLALEALVAPLDTTTSYYSKSQKAVIDEDTKGNLVGIGIEVRKDPATDLLAVVTPIKGGPAYRAGLQAGDRIITIIRETDGTGKPLDRADVTATKGRTLGELIDKLRGQPGTPVTLTVERDGADQPLRYTVKRAVVGMESVYGWQRRKDDTWDWWLDRQGGIGYVRLRTFMPNTPAVLEQALRELKATPGALRGLVLDLRSNPGGVLNGAIEVSDLLIDDGLIVTVRPRTGAEQAHRGKHEGSYLNFPIVCLVNGETASGAEIVAACLQDHKRAVIVGERTFGKGNVDSYYVYGEAQFRITTSLFYRPSGKIIDKANATDAAWGVEPDEGYEARLTPKERAEVADGLTAARAIPRRDRPGAGARPAFRDRQLEKAIEYLRRRKN